MKKIKYLHCLKDEKFLDGAISLFETDERVSNSYVLFIQNPLKYKFKFIKSQKAETQEIDSFLNVVNDYDVVVLHSLTSVPVELISKIPSRIKIVWLMWGFDFYNYRVCNLDLLYPITKEAVNNGKWHRFMSHTRFHLFERIKYKKALSRIDFFSGVFPYEYELLKNNTRYSKIKAAPIDFYYGSTDFFVPETPILTIENKHNNIIIGNSADTKNNTLDVFDTIKDALDAKDIENIIVPLSYGENKRFISEVKRIGNAIWGNLFKPLDTYLPLKEYLTLISNCKSAIFFHERQQASDNVLMQFLYGARVFMSESSLMYQFLKKQGYHVFSLQKDLRLINAPLSDQEVLENRVLLSQNYSSSKLVERVYNMNSQIAKSIE